MAKYKTLSSRRAPEKKQQREFTKDRWDEIQEKGESEGTSPKDIIKLAVAAIIGLIALFVLYTYLTQNDSDDPVEDNDTEVTATVAPTEEGTPAVTTEPTVEATTEPTATPEPTKVPLDLSVVTVRVLNGSGTSGAAGGLATYLKNGGVGTTSTGNAPSFGFTDVTLAISPEQENSKELVDLLKEFHEKVVIEEDEALAVNNFVVTLGKL